jgi:hypothetical protein
MDELSLKSYFKAMRLRENAAEARSLVSDAARQRFNPPMSFFFTIFLKFGLMLSFSAFRIGKKVDKHFRSSKSPSPRP